jgi:APA family basic amino acid/polyamine antiporter
MDTGYDLRFFVGQRVSSRLKEEIGLIGLIAVIVGLNIGGSLFVLTTVAAGLTGSSLILVQLVSATPIILSVPAYAMLSSAMPTTCANYQYAKLFSRPLAVAAWMVLFIALPLGMLPLFAVAAAKLVAVLIPAAAVTPTAIAVMCVIYLINVLGVRLTTQVQFVGVGILSAALLTFIFGGLPSVQISNLSLSFAGGVTGFLGASAILYTLLAGGLFGIEMGDEIRNARKVIPRALIASIVIVLVLYLLIEIVAVGVVGWEKMSEGTLGDVAAAFLSGFPLGLFVVGGGIMASTTTINMALTAAGRYVLAFSIDGYFPRFFSRVNERFGTPHAGLTLVFVMTVVALGFSPDLMTLGQMVNFGLLFLVTLVLLASVRMLQRHPETYAHSTLRVKPRFMKVTAICAVIINVLFMLILAIALKWTFLFFAGAIAFGFAIFYLKQRGILRRIL